MIIPIYVCYYILSSQKLGLSHNKGSEMFCKFAFCNYDSYLTNTSRNVSKIRPFISTKILKNINISIHQLGTRFHIYQSTTLYFTTKYHPKHNKRKNYLHFFTAWTLLDLSAALEKRDHNMPLDWFGTKGVALKWISYLTGNGQTINIQGYLLVHICLIYIVQQRFKQNYY